MAKNHNADVSNSNRGTSGTNQANQSARDNSSNQQNPNHSASKGSGKR
jgi:hypothetical protein